MAKNSNKCCKKTSIGGQALMEGIMMRGPVTTAMAVRNTSGEIVVEIFPTEAIKRAGILKWPIIRGVVAYIDSMTLGTKCLMRSAEIAGLEEAEEELRLEKEAKKAAKAAKKAEKKARKQVIVEENVAKEAKGAENCESAPQAVEAETVAEEKTVENENDSVNADKKSKKKKEDSSILGVMMPIVTILSFVIAILIFFYLPTYLFKWAQIPFPFLTYGDEMIQSLIKSVFEGSFKVVVLVGYMCCMLLMKDMRRIFQFHGAEHKTIFCYEAGLELTVENVKKQRRFHPRCGTSFLILMVLVSIFVSFWIDPISIWLSGAAPATAIRAVIRIGLIPLIVGVGYELIKIAGKHDNFITKIISAPGVWLQHITVLEPSDDMIECAIVAMKDVIPNDESDNW